MVPDGRRLRGENRKKVQYCLHDQVKTVASVLTSRRKARNSPGQVNLAYSTRSSGCRAATERSLLL